MRGVTRPPAPACFATDTEERAQAHRARYANPRFPSGGWRAHWNDLEKDAAGIGAIRRALLALFDNECAYCGLLVGNDHMQVDHFLPKEEFPLIAYAWENLLPSCDTCNRRKFQLTPESLKNKRIVERCLLEQHADAIAFDKAHLFREVARDDRLVDPSFDDPAEHLEIVMDIPVYRPKTPIGDLTYTRLLHHREIASRLAKTREAARVAVEVELSPQDLAAFAATSSHPSIFWRFVAYWRGERDAGRLS